jgi:hypothetical protein
MVRRFTAHVRNGVIVADDVALTDGAVVTAFDDADRDLADDALTTDEEALVERGRAELARGEGMSSAELADALRRDRLARHPAGGGDKRRG